MQPSRAELASIATTVEELTARITSFADQVVDDDEALGIGLFEAERSLRAAGRQLDKVVRRL